MYRGSKYLRPLVVAFLLILVACENGDDSTTATTESTTDTTVSSTTSSTEAPTTTIPVVAAAGQFCEDAQADQEVEVDGKKLRCEFNPDSNRHHWVEVPPVATTTTLLVETASYEPGSPQDPWGPILCPRLSHPAHHSPCPKKIVVASYEQSAPKKSTQRASGGGGAGGELASIRACESGGNYQAVSPDGKYHGAYQFDRQTWAAAGGSGNPANASPAEQDQRAAAWIAAGNRGAWPNC